MHKRLKIKKGQLALLRLRAAIAALSNDLVKLDIKPYRIVVRKIFLVDHEVKTVGKMGNNIKFEVRSSEAHHNEAHFHITIRGQGSGSYRISDLSPIETSIPKIIEKKLLVWAWEHRQILVDTWNEYHGYRVTIE